MTITGSSPPAEGPEAQESSSRQRFLQLYETLRTRICLLDYPPGSKLSEKALAAEFGVSRTPLRRVLGWLESQGLLKSVQGVGTIVSDVDLDALSQVYQLRMEMAELIGKLAPVQPSAATIARFRDLHARSLALIKNPEPRGFAQLNMEFFHDLMRLTGNEPLRGISERLYYQTSRIWLQSIPKMDLAEEVVIFSREIADILSAVEIGDLQAAGHIRRSHISMSFTRLRRQRG